MRSLSAQPRRVAVRVLSAAAGLLALSLLAFTGPARAGVGSFSVYPVGIDPAAVASIDADGDGRSDVAVASTGTDAVTVRLRGSFGAFDRSFALTLTAGAAPIALAVGDFAGSGRTQLVTANRGSGSISLFEAIAVGGTPSTLSLGAQPVGLAAGDLNGDGIADLVAVTSTSAAPAGVAPCATKGCALILLGSREPAGAAGVGHLRLIAAVPLTDLIAAADAELDPRGAAVGDLDGDGKAELAVSLHGTGEVVVLPGVGDGTFGLAYRHLTATDVADVSISPAGVLAAGSDSPVGPRFWQRGGDGTLVETSLAGEPQGASCVSSAGWAAHVALAAAGAVLVDGSSGSWETTGPGAACGQADELKGVTRVAILTPAREDNAGLAPGFAAVRPDGNIVVALPGAVLRSPARVDLRSVAPGKRKTVMVRIRVTAATDAPLALRASVAGPDRGDFAVGVPVCAAGDTCTLSVTFAPTTIGAKRATVTVAPGKRGAGFPIALAGRSDAPAQAPRKSARSASAIAYGVAEDAPKYNSDSGISVYRDLEDLRMTLDRVTMTWDPADPDREFGLLRQTLDAAARHGWKGKLVVSVFPLPRKDPATGKGIHPDTDAFCSWAGHLAETFAGRIGSYIVGNEPNLATFWPRGNRAAELYRMLADCYDDIKAADPAATVAGLGLSPRAPSAASDQPLALLRQIGTVYRADLARSNRVGGRPLFDVLAIHPYPNQSVKPTRGPDKGGYPNKNFFGIPNLDRVKQAVYDAFAGTAQKTTVTGLKLAIDEVGWQIDTTKLPGYTGTENSGIVPDEATQAAYYDEAIRDWFSCDPTIGQVMFFHLIDEPERGSGGGGGGWQSGFENVSGGRRQSYWQVKSAIAKGRSACTTGLVAWKPGAKKTR